jgi:Leucine-rich repeat (LRR) protein
MNRFKSYASMIPMWLNILKWEILNLLCKLNSVKAIYFIYCFLKIQNQNSTSNNLSSIMKKYLQITCSIILMMMTFSLSAQTINIPDANFKNRLVNEMGLDKNSDGQIQQSEILAVTFLDVESKKIASLEGIEHFTNLVELRCSWNKLTELDLSKLTQLQTLQCFGNQLVNLNLSNLTQLQNLNCSNNQLTELNLNDLAQLLILEFSKNQITQIDVSNLTMLKKLDCNTNQLVVLNLSNLSQIQNLYCQNNQLVDLNVSNLTQLQNLYCYNNQLTELDLNNLTQLEMLYCNNNQIKQLNVSNLTQLLLLECSNNQITQLDVSNLNLLEYLVCNNNQLTQLDVTNLTDLNDLKCSNNQITQLDVSNLNQLGLLECNNNQITQFNVGNINQLEILDCSNNQITQFDVSNITGLVMLYCNNNRITQLNVSNLTGLEDLFCENNQLTQLDVSNLTGLNYLGCGSNQLTKLDVTNLTQLQDLKCSNNQITQLDISNLTQLRNLECHSSPLEYIYLKNNFINNIQNFKIFKNSPNLKYICADAEEVDQLKQMAIDSGYPNVIINSFCNPAGDFYTLKGQIKLDFNNNGCDVADMVYPNLKIKISNSVDTGSVISGTNGDFSTDLIEGTYTFQPIIEFNNYYTISPQSAIFTLPNTISPTFCITPNGVHNDLSVSIIPTRAARPGFSDATYKVVYKNQGTTTQSGLVTFNYDEAKMNFITSSPIANNTSNGKVSFNFSGLKPFETRSAIITMRTNSPSDNPAVNSGDELEFTAVINGAADETPNDNLATLSQTVVGSFDPNDKTCLEGDIVSPELIGKNVHYLIRFENEGTANAENIVVTDYIDTNVFDINTLLITDASHICHIQISEGNKVQFIFSDIQLPFTEPDKHGHIAFSIKLKENLVIGDSIQNKADIYFDYNLPVATNKAVSEINYKTITYIGRNNSIKAALDIYPNPSNGQFSLDLKVDINSKVQISILNIEGKVVFAREINHQQHSLLPLNLKGLAKGVYLIKAQIENNVFSKKVVIQ